MKELETTKTEYHIHRFMYDLGIRGSVLSVYAALYSFTVGERGLFHGSTKYLAESLSLSERTVYRAYKELFGLYLIERYATEDGRYEGVRCVDLLKIKKKREKDMLLARERRKEYEEALARDVEARKAEAKASEERTVGEELSRIDGLCARMAAKCEAMRAASEDEGDEQMREASELDGRTLAHISTEHEKNTFIMMKRYERSGDNRRFMSFGKSGGVIMTEPQYRRLLELLPTEELMPYLVKLENMLEENLKSGRKPPHSHYKVIKKWIEEDTAL